MHVPDHVCVDVRIQGFEIVGRGEVFKAHNLLAHLHVFKARVFAQIDAGQAVVAAIEIDQGLVAAQVKTGQTVVAAVQIFQRWVSAQVETGQMVVAAVQICQRRISARDQLFQIVVAVAIQLCQRRVSARVQLLQPVAAAIEPRKGGEVLDAREVLDLSVLHSHPRRLVDDGLREHVAAGDLLYGSAEVGVGEMLLIDGNARLGRGRVARGRGFVCIALGGRGRVLVRRFDVGVGSGELVIGGCLPFRGRLPVGGRFLPRLAFGWGRFLDDALLRSRLQRVAERARHVDAAVPHGQYRGARQAERLIQRFRVSHNVLLHGWLDILPTVTRHVQQMSNKE